MPTYSPTATSGAHAWFAGGTAANEVDGVTTISDGKFILTDAPSSGIDFTMPNIPVSSSLTMRASAWHAEADAITIELRQSGVTISTLTIETDVEGLATNVLTAGQLASLTVTGGNYQNLTMRATSGAAAGATRESHVGYLAMEAVLAGGKNLPVLGA